MSNTVMLTGNTNKSIVNPAISKSAGTRLTSVTYTNELLIEFIVY